MSAICESFLDALDESRTKEAKRSALGLVSAGGLTQNASMGFGMRCTGFDDKVRDEPL
jgi:hypothetical protein